MTIETKFKEGDPVFFIHNAKVIKSTVRGFRIERSLNESSNEFETVITYLCNEKEGERLHLKVAEDIAFPTKEKLLKSL